MICVINMLNKFVKNVYTYHNINTKFEHSIYLIQFYYRRKRSCLKLKVYDNTNISTEKLFTQFVYSFKIFTNPKLYVDYHKMQSVENLLLIFLFIYFF